MIIKNIKGHFEKGTISIGSIKLFGLLITTKKNLGNFQIKDTTLIIDEYEEIINQGGEDECKRNGIKINKTRRKDL